MPAKKKPRSRPAAAPTTAYSPAEPAAFAEHVIHAECGRVRMSVHCDVRDAHEPPGDAFIRLEIRGREGHEQVDIDFTDVDDFLRSLAEALRLARHHRMIPEEGSEEMQRRRHAQLEALYQRQGVLSAPPCA